MRAILASHLNTTRRLQVTDLAISGLSKVTPTPGLAVPFLCKLSQDANKRTLSSTAFSTTSVRKGLETITFLPRVRDHNHKSTSSTIDREMDIDR
ncbi:hypothetical protein TNCV_1472361 [Trichonephila clavipes]|nr:hypothetical protein TNCV_1472361 [Trichonephila clavipes]